MAREYLKRQFLVTINVQQGLHVPAGDLMEYIKYRLNLRDHIQLASVEMVAQDVVKEG